MSSRNTSPLVNGVRYFLFVVGVLMLRDGQTSDMAKAWAVAFVIAGFPYFLLEWLGRLFAWVFRLFGIGKRKPAPQMRVAVEWGDVPATEKQLGFIHHLGGNPPKGLTKSAASDMIDALLAEKRGRT